MSSESGEGGGQGSGKLGVLGLSRSSTPSAAGRLQGISGPPRDSPTPRGPGAQGKEGRASPLGGRRAAVAARTCRPQGRAGWRRSSHCHKDVNTSAHHFDLHHPLNIRSHQSRYLRLCL